MIALRAGRAVVLLARTLYRREDLAAAALALGRRARVQLSSRGARYEVTIQPPRPSAPARLTALAGEFLNAALSHGYRRETSSFSRGLAAPVLTRLLERGFVPVPPDPLEQLEPQVKKDRGEETQKLLAEARALDVEDPLPSF